MSDIALELSGVTKRFGRSVALDGASLTVRRGTLHAVLGENGAGKTTLMRIAYGMLKPDAGTIRVNGVERSFASPADAIRSGIGMVHQHFTLVPAMTVAENVALGGTGTYVAQRARAMVLETGRRTGLDLDPDARVADLVVGAQQRVEIVKALAHDARILILDEPTAVLTPAESRDLLGRAREFARSGGSAIVITHKLREAIDFADEITVLRRGSTVWTGAPSSTSQDELVSAMVGTIVVSNARNDTPRPAGDVAIALHDVRVKDARGIERLRGVSLDVREGEIVGVAAVEGNGQRELLRIAAGRLACDSGRVTIPNRVGFVPEDRKRDALAGDMTLTENVALAGARARNGLIDWRSERAKTVAVMRDYDVRAEGPDTKAAALSGGNQQKLVLGRELTIGGRALVVENPSRGLDVQATAAVHARLRAARDAGTAVLLYSSDLDEVLALADRVIVMSDGTLTEPILDRESIGQSMLGLSIAVPA